MADSENSSGGGLDLSMLSGLLSNPEVMSKVSGVLSSLSNSTEKAEEPAVQTSATPDSDDLATKLSSVMENKELMSKLPDVMAAMGPLLSGVGGGGKGGGDGHGKGGGKRSECDKRTALLLALKPYMSPRRCEAIDYFIRINKLGDVIKTIT